MPPQGWMCYVIIFRNVKVYQGFGPKARINSMNTSMNNSMNFSCVELDFSSAAYAWINEIAQNGMKGSSMHCVYLYKRCCIVSTLLRSTDSNCLRGNNCPFRSHMMQNLFCQWLWRFWVRTGPLSPLLKGVSAFYPKILLRFSFLSKGTFFFFRQAKCLQASHSETHTATHFTKVA